MILYVRDRNREIIDVVDNAKSIIWNPKYYDDGEFEIYIEATEKNVSMFSNGYYVTRFEDEYIGVIEKVEVTEDVEQGNFITVTGRFAESILSYRIIRYLTYLKGDMQSQLEVLIKENAIDPTYYAETRKIECLEIGDHKLLNNPILDMQVTYDNLLEYARSVLKTAESGIKVNLNLLNNKLSVIMYTGLDRTDKQEVNERVVFSTEYDNLLKSNYIFDISKEVNALYVGGEGEGTDRIVDKYELPLSETEVVTDIDRKEAFLDSSSIKSIWKDEEGNEHQLNITTEYRPLLQEAGKQAVVSPEETLEGEIDISTYLYRVDYNLGDKVTIHNSLIDKNIDVRIVEIQEIEDEEGYRIVPVFS